MRKIKMIGIIMAVGVLFSTLAVMAASKSEIFGVGESRAEAKIYTGDAKIQAYTIPQSKTWNFGHVQTRCLYYSANDGTPQKTEWESGARIINGYYGFTDAVQFVYAGESSHGIDGFITYLYCSY